ncbi:MAG: 5-(carboxyamino)imidazole ribonucleotide mutase [Candidatus Methanospirare jalkutatii]|nr:5-(carboxyamino)imidazole ribonucleotide mutase [Candidatus Methanospirare jalkutatii]UYZ39704.1 MAG: 5-(carboxyamino)imidazole ribonucleotide mutase [Candidatus Methanospirare jalkutatii]UYZ40137.1 MAG: 5-(carboxyamino)imidazole ribonucleotide mutase [Candidatus Methanospirare jalkutatii]
MSKVAVILGSESDMPIAERVVKVLEREGVSYELKVISAHRQPEELDRYLREKSEEVSVFIAIAGLSAALPGVIASKTDKVVIGVPVSGKLMGLDALLSMVQMPAGVPVAVVGIDNGENAALLALRILNLKK